MPARSAPGRAPMNPEDAVRHIQHAGKTLQSELHKITSGRRR
jgi:hypothetical protein